VSQQHTARYTDDTQEVASAASRELQTLRPGSCKKRVAVARPKQTVATNGQLKIVVVTGSNGRYGQQIIRKENELPDNKP